MAALSSLVKDDKPQTIDRLQKAKAHFFVLQDREHVKTVFRRYIDMNGKLDESNFKLALQDLGISMDPSYMKHFQESEVDGGGGLDLIEFERIVNLPSKLEQWSSSLPLAKLLACCLQAADLSAEMKIDPVRSVSNLEPKALDLVAEEFCDGVKHLLKEQSSLLKHRYAALDRKANEAYDGSSNKFQTFSMSAGGADNFHNGLTDRVGARMVNPQLFLCIKLEIIIGVVLVTTLFANSICPQSTLT